MNQLHDRQRRERDGDDDEEADDVVEPIGVEPRESIETNGVTSMAGDATADGVGPASCALAGDADTANASTAVVRLVHTTAFIRFPLLLTPIATCGE